MRLELHFTIYKPHFDGMLAVVSEDILVEKASKRLSDTDKT